MGVLDPDPCRIENYPENQIEEFAIGNNSLETRSRTRRVPFSRELYIEPRGLPRGSAEKFFRLAPGP